MMTCSKRREYPTRSAILRLLSDEERSRTVEATRLPEGEDFVDLDHLYRGILRSEPFSYRTVTQALPRSALDEQKWTEVCACVERLVKARSGPTDSFLRG